MARQHASFLSVFGFDRNVSSSVDGPRIRYANDEEIARWDELVLQSPDEGHVFRSQSNIEGMRVQGHMPVYLFVDDTATTAFCVNLPPFGSYWVVLGPSVENVEELLRSARSLAAFAAGQGIAAVRVRPMLLADPDDERFLLSNGLTRVPTWIPDHTLIVDLSGSEDEVLARFKSKARQKIRRSKREGVTVERAHDTDENYRIMFDLVNATGEGRFPVGEADVFIATLRRWADNGQGALFFAKQNGTLMAGAFVLKFGKNALYLAGGSVRGAVGDSSHSGLGSTGVAYALQWHIMQWAREQGCDRYDMYGTPSMKYSTDPTHPLYGVGRFKLHFNNEISDYLGCYQVSAKPFAGWLLWQVERSIERAKYSPRLNHHLKNVPQRSPDYVWLG